MRHPRLLLLAVLAGASLPATAQMRITEYMYSGTNQEFVEFTNVGAAPIDMTGWRFRNADPADTSLSAFGVVAPGESVILTDGGADAFRTAWSLCAAVKVIGGNVNKLGRDDEIRLYDATDTLVDTLDYGDEQFVGSIRTQNVSGRVDAAGLGANDAMAWVLSSVGDGEASVVSIGGDIGSPGRSPTHATVAFDACPVAGGAMRITEFMYSGRDAGDAGEFVEFTNVGDAAVDLTGWSYADSGTDAGAVPLDALGTVLPGESVILAEAAAADFRAAWSLCPDAKILGGNGVNLGRGDTIKLFDAGDVLVDTLDYGDQAFAGTIRTQNVSGWAPAAALGENDIAAWQLSVVDDAQRSVLSLAGDIASPAYSTQSDDPFDVCPPTAPPIRITEFMYKGANDEFIEFTNVGLAPVDMSGWSYDDDSATPGSLDLSVFGVVQPGESVIVAEAGAAAFRSAWGLCDGVKVLGGNAVGNLGNGDTIHLFTADAQLADSLSYPSDGPPFTDGVSAWASAAAVGIDDASLWVLSSVGDAEDSVTSSGGDIGRPGTSARRAVDFDACVGVEGAPRITLDPVATSRYLSLAANGSGALSGVVDDPTDPAATIGIGVAFADDDGVVGDLVVTVSSSNTAVVDAAGLVLDGAPGSDTRVLRIVPHGVGRSVITLRAEDLDGNAGNYTFDYAASAAAADPQATRFHTGSSDASTAIAIDADWMFVADDENQVLRLYNRTQSGLHQAGFDLTSHLALTDIDDGVPREVDIEGSTRSGDRLFWIGAHDNQASGNHNPRPNRRRVFATDLSGSGELASLAYAGRYDFLLEDMVAWDNADGHGLGAAALGLEASSAPNLSPEVPEGLNIEGLVLAPDGSTAYVAFRAPLQSPITRDRALLVPVQQFDALVTAAAPDSAAIGSASFAAPVLLDLGGRAIRSIDRNAAGVYLIVAGPAGSAGAAPNDFVLYRWSGEPADVPVLLPVDLAALALDGSVEGIVEVPRGGTDAEVQLVVDNGTAVYYGDGTEAKDLSERRQAKFRSVAVGVPLPLATEIFADDFED